MIHLVTLNPALDFFFRLDEPVSGKIGAVSQAGFAAGGKALQVARFLGKFCVSHRLWLGVGREREATQVAYRALLQAEGIKIRFLRTATPVRMNLVLEKDGSTGKYNQMGEPLSTLTLKLFQKDLRKTLKAGDTLVLNGRLAPGNEGTYAGLVQWSRSQGIKAVVDTSGPGLAEALRSGPWFFKVNLFEFREALGRRIESLRRIHELIPALRSNGLLNGAVTHGAKGAILWNEREVLGVNLKVKARKLVVGGGDGFMAGYLKAAGENSALKERARWACATAAAVAVQGMFGFEEKTVNKYLSRVEIKDL